MGEQRGLQQKDNSHEGMDKWPSGQVANTGDKGPNTHWVHGENIEIAVNM